MRNQRLLKGSHPAEERGKEREREGERKREIVEKGERERRQRD